MPELSSQTQPVEVSNSNTLPQEESTAQKQIPPDNHVSSKTTSQTESQTQVDTSEKEALFKRGNTGSISNANKTDNQDQITDGTSQTKAPKDRPDTDMLTTSIQDPFYYYLYYPDDELPAVTDTFLDNTVTKNSNEDNSQVSEDAVINNLAKSVMAVIQYDLETKGNSINNNINNNINTNSDNSDISDMNNNNDNVQAVKEQIANALKEVSNQTNKETAAVANLKTEGKNAQSKEEAELARFARP